MSSRWQALKRSIDTLRKQFLPEKFDALGEYAHSSRVRAQTRAFLLLSHAEVETYLEEWAKEIARASEAVWKKSGRVVTPLACLLGSLGGRISLSVGLKAGAKDTQQELKDVVERLFQDYYTRIGENHGIRERNVLTLFCPLGVQWAAFGATLLPDLDTLGIRRGEHAHQSVKSVKTVLDPETEYKRVTRLVDDLAEFDRWLVTYRSRIR